MAIPKRNDMARVYSTVVVLVYIENCHFLDPTKYFFCRPLPPTQPLILRVTCMLGSTVLPVIQELILIIRGEQEKERERFGLPRLDGLLKLTWGYKV